MYLENVKRNFRSILAQAKTYQTEILIGLTVVLLLRLILNLLNSRKRNFPPGPRGLPKVGYLPFISKDTHLDFIELGKKYGGVFSIKLGSEELVVLNDSEAIKEAKTKKEINGRKQQSGLGLILPNSAFFARDNYVWGEQRRFVVHSMKDLGLGKSKIEQEIQDEVNILLDILKNTKGQPLELKKPLSPSMSNNICALVFGKRYDFKDPIRSKLDTHLDIGIKNASHFGFNLIFPWFFSIPFVKRLLPLQTAIESFNFITDICKQEVQSHKKDFNSKSSRDFIDSYLVEIQAKKNVPHSYFNGGNSKFLYSLLKGFPEAAHTFKIRPIFFYGWLNFVYFYQQFRELDIFEESLVANVVDLFTAGSETVRTTILWCIYVIAAYPDVQRKVQKEILDVIGSERSPEYLDQKNMPYTHAVIMEIQRWKTIIPINFAGCVTENSKIAGYDIPKGTTVLSNFWSVHHDPKLWDDPDSFKPERFLSSDKRSIVKSSNFMAFSLGKRACPGETMANMEMFLYFTSILQKFDVVLPEGVKPDLEGTLAVVYLPKPYKVCFIPRS